MRNSFLAVVCALLILPFAAEASLLPAEVKSEAGVKAWFIEDHSLPTFSVIIYFAKSGYAYEPAGKEGLVNIYTRMILEGAGKYDSKAFHDAIQDNAIEFSIQEDEDALFFNIRSLSRNREKMQELISLALSSPKFGKTELERIKKEIMAELKAQEQNPGFTAGREWKKLAYGEHPYSRYDYPNDKSIKSITPLDLKRYKDSNITRSNVQVSVVGDISPDDVKKLLDSLFNGLPAEQKVEYPLEELQLGKPALKLTKSDIPQSVVVFGQEGVKRKDPDYIPLYVLNHIVGAGSFNSRLMMEVREKTGLTYGIGTYLEPLDYGAAWAGGFSTKNEDAAKAIEKVKEEFKKLHESGVTETELKEAKDQIMGSFALSLDTNMKVATFLSVMQRYDLGRDYLEKRNSLFQAVTMDDMNRLSKGRIHPDRLIFSVVGNPAEMN